MAHHTSMGATTTSNGLHCPHSTRFAVLPAAYVRHADRPRPTDDADNAYDGGYVTAGKGGREGYVRTRTYAYVVCMLLGVGHG